MKEDSKDKIINNQKKEITTLKRKIVDLEKEVFTNNKRQRLDSDDIVEDEKIQKLKVQINNIVSEYLEILHTERVCLKKYKNNDQINKYINYRESINTEFSISKYDSYLLKLDEKIIRSFLIKK